MPKLIEHKLFISHSYDLDRGNAIRLTQMLVDHPNFRFRDNSVLATRRFSDGEDVKPQIQELIRQSDALILICRPSINENDNVLFELETARRYGIPVIAVPSPDVSVRAAIVEQADVVSKWSAREIVKAIRSVSLSGKPRGSYDSELLPSPELIPLPELSFVPGSTDSVEKPSRQGFFAKLFGAG